jgi:signal transduction histidine kinase
VKDISASITQEQDTNLHKNQRGFILLGLAPLFVFLVWFVFKSGVMFQDTESLFANITSALLIILYISSTIFYIIRNNKGRKDAEIPLFTDEIYLLASSMQTMQNNLKVQQEKLIASREKMQELARITLRSQEAERRHISRELHDQAGQLLVSLRYTVQTLLTELSPEDSSQAVDSLREDALKIRLSTMLTQIDKTLDTVRALSHKMRPALLDVGDINLAMQEYCTEFQQGKKITIDYEGAPIPFISDDAAISLFRFLQEALTNVLKHADASYVQVRLTYEDNWVKMSVEDNGRGETTSSNQKGIGILGMKERFLLLDGTVDASPSKGGFIITAKIPLAEAVNFPDPIA